MSSLLEHAIASDLNISDPQQSFNEILASATAAHNASPHSALGTSPINLLTGADGAFPGWAHWRPITDHDLRELTVTSHRSEGISADLSGRLHRGQSQAAAAIIKPGKVVLYSIRSVAQSDFPARQRR